MIRIQEAQKHTDPTDSDPDPQHGKKALTFTYCQDDAEEAVEAEEEAKRWSGQGGQVAFSYEEPPRGGQQPSAVPEVTDLPTEDRYRIQISKHLFEYIGTQSPPPLLPLYYTGKVGSITEFFVIVRH
jgi:hypothetical protein